MVQLLRAATCVCGLVLMGTAFAQAENASGEGMNSRGALSSLTSEPAPPENENPVEQEVQRHRAKVRVHRQIVTDGASVVPREAAPMNAFLNPAPKVAPGKIELTPQTDAIPRPRHFSAPRSCLASSDSSDSASRLS